MYQHLLLLSDEICYILSSNENSTKPRNQKYFFSDYSRCNNDFGFSDYFTICKYYSNIIGYSPNILSFLQMVSKENKEQRFIYDAFRNNITFILHYSSNTALNFNI